MTDLDTARRALDDAITAYCRASGHGNEIVTGWLAVASATASDLDDGDTGVLITTRQGQPYITNLGLAVHASRYFGPEADDE